MSSLKISKKHGVNPSLDICFYCNEPKGIALLGRLPNDEEAPREIFTSYTPCDICMDKFSKAFLLVEVEVGIKSDRPPILHNLVPTGQYWLVTNESAFKIFNAEIYRNGRVLIDKKKAIELGLYTH